MENACPFGEKLRMRSVDGFLPESLSDLSQRDSFGAGMGKEGQSIKCRLTGTIA
jgi:hypothetical protein